MYIFAMGLFKKVIIADTFGKAVSFGFNTIETLSSMEALLVSLSYTGIFCCS
jgi:alginate O-acetyltransferase complex protein AlgI